MEPSRCTGFFWKSWQASSAVSVLRSDEAIGGRKPG